MRQALFFITVVIFITGCMQHSPKRIIKLSKQERIYPENNSYSILGSEEIEQKPFIAEIETYYAASTMVLRRNLLDLSFEHVGIYQSHGVPGILGNSEKESFYMQKDYLYLFDKNIDFDAWGKERLNRNINYYSQRTYEYIGFKIDYIANLKCFTMIEFSYDWNQIKHNFDDKSGAIKYSTHCGYIAKNGDKAFLRIDYGSIKAKKEMGSEKIITLSIQKQLQFKQDMKAIFDSLVIHDMDRERMKKEGLLHDKEYDVDTEERIPNNTGM